MKKTFLVMTIAAATMLITSCSSKKELLACQEENKALQTNYTDTKEKLAASTARVASLEKQLAQAENTNAALQNALDKSLSNASQNNVSIEKLVDQINESNKYIRHLVEVKSKSDSLNMVLTNNLTRSLSKEELKALPRHSRKLPRLSRITRTTTCSSRAIPTTFPLSARISATTGTSLVFAPLQSYRLSRINMVLIPSV